MSTPKNKHSVEVVSDFRPLINLLAKAIKRYASEQMIKNGEFSEPILLNNLVQFTSWKRSHNFSSHKFHLPDFRFNKLWSS